MTATEKAIKEAAHGNKEERAALDRLLTAAAQRGVAEYRRQQQRTVYQNTALLMKEYRTLKGYEGRAISNADEARAAGAQVEGQAWLRSIRKDKARTATMLAHLDAALEELRREAVDKGTGYMFEAHRLHYQEGKTLEEVAQILNTGKNTPGRWCKLLNERLAVLLFGIDGLHKW